MGFTVDVTELDTCRDTLVDIYDRAIAVRDLADSGDPEWYIWGAIGSLAAPFYWHMADSIHSNIVTMGDTLGSYVQALDCTAASYRGVEEATDQDFKSLRELLGTGDPAGSEDAGGSPEDSGGYDSLTCDPSTDIPVVATALNAAGTIPGAIGRIEDGDWWALTDIGESAADITGNVLLFAFDPFNYLLCAGLTFLIDLVQPLEDLLGLLTGNPERMDAEIAKWRSVSEELAAIASDIATATNDGLLSWEGEAADAARQRLNTFTEGILSLANDVAKLIETMGIVKAILEGAQAFVIALIATFVEWLVFTWTAAMAAAVPTGGGSTAAAAGATGLRLVGVETRAVSFVDRVVSLLERLRTVLAKMLPRTMAIAKDRFLSASPNVASAVAPGWKPLGTALTEVAKNYQTWISAGGKAVASSIRAAEETHADSVGDGETEAMLRGEC